MSLLVPIPTDLEAILERKYPFMDFWSAPQDLVTVAAVAADIDFNDIVVAGLPVGVTMQRVVLILTARALAEDSAADNYIDVADRTIRVLKDGGAWGTNDIIGITFPVNALYVAADSKEGGPVVIGSADIKAAVDGIGTYHVRTDETTRTDALTALADNLYLYDVQVGLRVFFS